MYYIKATISVLGTTFFYIVGGFDSAIKYLLIAMSLDYITGILKAFKYKRLSSEIGFEGIAKKVYYLVLVGLSVLVDHITGQSGIIRNLVIYYIIGNEGLSIIENGVELGFPAPTFLKESLEQIKNKKSEE